MNPLSILVACAGNWRGTNILQDPNTGSPAESESTATVTPVLEGQFVRMDYTWAYQGTPHKGSIVLKSEGTPEAPSEVIKAHWTDSWHMGNTVMACQGTVADTTISLLGSWSPPEGPDWGWRIQLSSDGSSPSHLLKMEMYVISPDGSIDTRAVEVIYARVSETS